MTPPTDVDWLVRTAVYQSFAATGKAPSLRDLAETFERIRSRHIRTDRAFGGRIPTRTWSRRTQ